MLFSVQDHVARVTIDRPERHNAVDQATEAELIRIWETIEKARDIRVAVLTGVGARAFCTGADMKGGAGVSGLEYWAQPRPGGFGGIALRSACPIFPPTSVTRRSRDRSHTRSNCRRYSANASRRTLLNFGSPGSTSGTCSALRC